MSDGSKIEWTDASWNPIRARLKAKVGVKAKGALGWHCEHVSEGCRNCYAEGINRRLGTGLDFKPGHFDAGDIEVYLDPEVLTLPLRWKRPRRIFVGSMTDLFGRFVTDTMLDKVFAVMALASIWNEHRFQVLTKRSQRMRKYVGGLRDRRGEIAKAGVWLGVWSSPDDVHDGIVLQLEASPLPNVWLGVSCERQEEADERVPDLMATPAAVRFVSLEPLLGPIDLSYINDGAAHREIPREYWTSFDDDENPPGLALNALTGERRIMHGEYTELGPSLDWVIAGGESGRKARPMSLQWARELRDQCLASRVAFFFKQWGEWAPAGLKQSGTLGRYAFEIDRSTMVEVDGYPRQFATLGSLSTLARVGKARAGRLLDGVEHSQFPDRCSDPAPALLETNGVIASNDERSISPAESEGGRAGAGPRKPT